MVKRTKCELVAELKKNNIKGYSKLNRSALVYLVDLLHRRKQRNIK
jgi:hypothetical protein